MSNPVLGLAYTSSTIFIVLPCLQIAERERGITFQVVAVIHKLM